MSHQPVVSTQNDPPPTGRVDPPNRERREFVSLMASRVSDVFLRKPFFVDGATDLVSLCREMSERGITEALVRDGDRIGIFTTTNLRDALLQPEPPSMLQVRKCATFDPHTVSPDDELYDALILMLRHRIHRVLVCKDDQIVGVLGQLDLMAFVASHSHLISAQVTEAASVADLRLAAHQIDSLIAVLHEDGVRVEVIAGLVVELNRQVFRRLWELLAPPELRENSCLIVMGSEGRGEQIIKTDQDNALLLRDGFEFEGLDRITAAFTEALIEFGYPPCPGGIMLSKPLWCQQVSSFRDTVRNWIYGGDPDGPMNIAIFVDAEVVAGDPALLDEVRNYLNRILNDNAAWFAHFVRAVDQFSEGRSWWSRLPGMSGRAAAEIDIKKLGIFPIVHGVRALALQKRVRALGTVARLQALEAGGHIEAGPARDLTDAIRFLIGLKLSNNLLQVSAGRAPNNTIRLSEMGTLDRQSLRDSLTIVRDFKQFLSRHFRLDAL